MLESTQHTRFAHIWNEVVDAMREEDIISNSERDQVRSSLPFFMLERSTLCFHPRLVSAGAVSVL